MGRPSKLACVTAYFVEIEAVEADYFASALSELELHWVDDLAEVGADAEILSIFIYSPIHEDFLQAHPRLRLIAVRASTDEHIDTNACRRAGVAVCTVSGYGDTTVAEHAFALILALSRRLRELMALPKERRLDRRFSYAATRGYDLAGKTLGIIGMGRIGRRVAAFAQAFGMRVIAHDPFDAPPALAAELGFEWGGLEEVLRSAHVLSLHVRISPATHHLLRRETLALCRRGVLIVNTARGRLIDTQALSEALDSGQVGGAGLDVLEEERVMRESASQIISAQIVEHLHAATQPDAAQQSSRVQNLQDLMLSDALLARPNVVFTPHVAFNSVEAVERLNAATVENIRAFAERRKAEVER